MMQSAFWQARPCGGNLPSHHSDALRLNQLRNNLSYPGWQDDYMNAERAVLTNPEDLEDVHLFKLEEKQRMFSGDRSHLRLVKLDSYVFTYPGWQLDVREVEESHVLHRSGCFFDDALEGMLNKEKVNNGDRSHPNLVTLDRLKKALSYAGWEDDFLAAEKSHLTRPDDLQDYHIFKLIEKQRMHYGDRSHKRLRQLDSYDFNYPGWEADKRIAEEEHVMHKKSPWFDRILQTMQNRQRLFTVMHRRCTVAAVAASKDPSTTLKEVEPKKETGTCVICMSGPKSHAFIPCGHLCACEVCAFEAFGRSGVCPICRTDSDTVTRIFFS